MNNLKFEFTSEQLEALRKASAFDFTPEQQEKIKETIENVIKVFNAIIEEVSKVAKILIEAFGWIWVEYQYRQSEQYRRNQAEYWFLWSQSKRLLIE